MPSYDKPNRSEFFNGPIYDRMAEDLQLTGKAQRTVYAYLRAMRVLADHCRKSPDQISETQLRRFFLHLKNNRKAAYGTQRVALSGIRFFYKTTCPRDWNVLAMPKLKNEKTLPEVITRQQVRLIIQTATTQRMRVFFWTVYSLGLRLNEALHLQVGDVDGQRKMVHIHRGKGAKDRYIPISQYKANLADALREAGLYHLVSAEVWKKKFVVDIQPVDNGRSTVAYLAPYVHRVAISDHRIVKVDDTSVTYQYKPKKSLSVLSREVPGDQFVQSFAQHILPTQFRKVRYYGWMASNSKAKLEELRMIVWFTLGWVYWLATAHAPQTPINPFPKVSCRACRSLMRVIGITNTPLTPTLASHALAYLDSG